MNDIDLAYQNALSADREARRADPGTDRRYPTFIRGGTVTSATAGVPACEVDGLPAYNWTGWNLAVNDVVLLAVVQGARMVVGVAEIKES